MDRRSNTHGNGTTGYDTPSRNTCKPNNLGTCPSYVHPKTKDANRENKYEDKKKAKEDMEGK